jgi:hypothetical protein
METPQAHDNVHCLPYELEAPHLGLVCQQVFTNLVHLDVKPAIRPSALRSMLDERINPPLFFSSQR